MTIDAIDSIDSIDSEITRQIDVQRTPRVQQLEGLFDIPPSRRSERTWHHHFTLPDNWSVGAIVGPSGCGKTTLIRQAFGDHLIDHFQWPDTQSILDGFPPSLGIREITGLLCSVGFSSPPSWVRPFAALSNGEQFRVNLARTLAELPRLAVMDEFTSVVDRTAARIGSAAVAKAVRSRGQKFIAATCHYDVLDWLAPDWVYEPYVQRFTVNTGPRGSRGSLWRRPPVELEIVRATASAWKLFAPHHYLAGSLHRSAQCYVALARLGDDAGDALPAAFVAALPFPHPSRPGWREHRCVCLPDFQGIGIGNTLSEFVAGIYAAQGKRYRSTTSHPGMIRHRAGSPKWRMIRGPGLGQRHRGLGSMGANGITRLTASFEYVGTGSK